MQPRRRRRESNDTLNDPLNDQLSDASGHGVPIDTAVWEWEVRCTCGRTDWLTTSAIVAAFEKADPSSACRTCAAKRGRDKHSGSMTRRDADEARELLGLALALLSTDDRADPSDKALVADLIADYLHRTFKPVIPE